MVKQNVEAQRQLNVIKIASTIMYFPFSYFNVLIAIKVATISS